MLSSLWKWLRAKRVPYRHASQNVGLRLEQLEPRDMLAIVPHGIEFQVNQSNLITSGPQWYSPRQTVALDSAGNFVVPDAASFQAAASSADWNAEKDFHLVLTNAPGEDAYPITATTFVLMPKTPKSPERSTAAIDFVRWSLENGRSQAETLNYVPLPTALIDQIERYWQQSIQEAPTVSASATVKR